MSSTATSGALDALSISSFLALAAVLVLVFFVLRRIAPRFTALISGGR